MTKTNENQKPQIDRRIGQGSFAEDRKRSAERKAEVDKYWDDLKAEWKRRAAEDGTDNFTHDM